MKNFKEATDNVLTAVLIILGIAAIFIPVIGWVLNIVKLVPLEGATGMLVLRGVGIFLAPLGAVFGFIG